MKRVKFKENKVWSRLVCSLAIALASGVSSVALAAQDRIVSLGGTVTEIVYKLDQQDQLVATDLSSYYPPAAAKLKRVGYYRDVPVEGVVSVKPSLVLASEHAGPKASLDKLRSLGVKIQTVSDDHSVDSLYKRVTQVAQALDVPDRGAALNKSIKQSMAEVAKLESKPYRTTLIMGNTGTLNTAGGNTAADAVMGLAGLKNIYKAQKGYKPVSAESLTQLDPELIIITKNSVKNTGGLDKFKDLPAIKHTTAAKEGRIVVMDDLLILGMGPRLPEAIKQLKSIK